jgi:DNA mismatch endonuclease, patch repair protein
MSRVKGANTSPELRVRKQAHALGLRFRLHRKDLPGRPDLTFAKYKTTLFVHGCFWHRHEGCAKASMPKSRRRYWRTKFLANIERDGRVQKSLETRGWRVLIIWECETKNHERLLQLLASHFDLKVRRGGRTLTG